MAPLPEGAVAEIDAELMLEHSKEELMRVNSVDEQMPVINVSTVTTV